MAAFVHDQAEGLRRLFRPDVVRVLAVASAVAGVGKATLLVNLAATLARRGRRVLILSERDRPPPTDLVPAPAHDLGAVLAGRRKLDQIVASGPAGVGWLRLGDAVSRLAQLGAADQEALAADFGRLARLWDVVLLDPMPGLRSPSMGLSLAAQERLLVASPAPQSITETYALIKRLVQGFGERRFHLVLNKVRTGAQAEGIYNNLQATVGRYLVARIEWLASVPSDPRVRQAERLGRTLDQTFPDSPAAFAMRGLAEAIEGWPWPDAESGRLETFLNKLVMTSRLTAESAHS